LSSSSTAGFVPTTLRNLETLDVLDSCASILDMRAVDLCSEGTPQLYVFYFLISSQYLFTSSIFFSFLTLLRIITLNFQVRPVRTWLEELTACSEVRLASGRLYSWCRPARGAHAGVVD
jgi:hypothetical protein